MEFDALSIIVAIFGVIGTIWKSFDAKFWKKMAKEGYDLAVTIDKAKDEKSPGGKEITEDEYSAIGKEAIELVVPIIKKVEGNRKSKKALIGK